MHWNFLKSMDWHFYTWIILPLQQANSQMLSIKVNNADSSSTQLPSLVPQDVSMNTATRHSLSQMPAAVTTSPNSSLFSMNKAQFHRRLLHSKLKQQALLKTLQCARLRPQVPLLLEIYSLLLCHLILILLTHTNSLCIPRPKIRTLRLLKFCIHLSLKAL